MSLRSPEPFAGHWELEVAAGRFDARYPGEQLAVAISGERGCPACDRLLGFTNVYGIVTSGSAWTFQEVRHNLALGDGDPLEFTGSPGNPYRSAVAAADLDADGYQEIAVWYVDRVFTIDLNTLDAADNPTIAVAVVEPRRPANNAQYDQSPRALAVGDIDRDGRAEIVAAAWLEDASTGAHGFRFALIEVLGDGVLSITRFGPAQEGMQGGTVLVGDTDGDSLVSELVGCAKFTEVKVVAVVNGAPRWYADGAPIQEAWGHYATSEGSGAGSESATRYNLGASLSIGFEREISIPFVGKVAEFRASVTQDIMHSWGVSESREEYTVGGDGVSFAEGFVVYSELPYTCHYYDVFSPASPADTTRAMACTPGPQTERSKSLDEWHTSIKDAAGAAWVDLGHRAPGGSLSNDLAEPGNYMSTLPVDAFLLHLQWEPVLIDHYAGTGPMPTIDWWITSGVNRSKGAFTELEENTTVSVGATLGSVSVDTSATFGMGWESSQYTNWTEELSFEGQVEKITDETKLCYTLVPFVYQAKARTLAGATYAYWEMDYYVPRIWQCD